tara:strand:+ start:1138 stop:1584 length:447 start_codon:yes stop_codon:yes gene_type:complete
MNISYGQHSQAKDYFGHADYYHHKNAGMSSQGLLDWVNSNMDKFSYGPRNQPGGGGLYDMMVRDAQMDNLMKISARREATYQPPAYQAPNIPDPKALTTSATAVGGSAKGVKIKRSKNAKAGNNTRGTRSLNRSSRNTQMQISNLNLA